MKRLAFLVVVAAVMFMVTGCAIGPQLIRNNAYDHKVSRTFNSDFKTTWSAMIKVMEAHPITTIEKDSGILLTDWVQGSSPLYLRKLFVPLAQRATKRAIGIYVAQLTPNMLYIVHALKEGPAYASGIRSQDLLVSCNGQKITKTSELVRCCSEAEKVNLTILRYGASEPLPFDIIPKKITFRYNYVPVSTRYKLNIRVSEVEKNMTEVKIINYEEADFGHYSQYGWHSNYKVIETSTLREKVLLDKIESELNKET
ncbi:MAG: PDZ domain-containing protein [Deltaproteobacteria bacterium]|nr:PDZ domain-containing protein [Deltaproteobacteria bacterium]